MDCWQVNRRGTVCWASQTPGGNDVCSLNDQKYVVFEQHPGRFGI